MPPVSLSLTLRKLEYWVAIAEHQSFRKAAQACHVSQPALSAQIAELEEQLGVRLFERGARSVQLTREGAQLLEHARAVLAEAQELLEAAHQVNDPWVGRLRLGILPTIGPYLLPELAPILRQRFPKLSFVWVEDKTPMLVNELARGELDGGVLALEAELGSLETREFGRDPFFFAASREHPLSGTKKPIGAEEISGECVLLLEDGHCLRSQALSFCAQTGVEETSYRATSLSTLVQMVAGGPCVTLLPSLCIPVENRNQTLSLRPLREAPFRTLGLVFRRGAARERTLEGVARVLGEAYAALKTHSR
ncbi:MAG TPA: LysR substrate-binding domain-containing protein [Polyangiaceae bacterium]|nr:LysR substrate-binding domain-containing protein [Polyangiaceae bacterium]